MRFRVRDRNDVNEIASYVAENMADRSMWQYSIIDTRGPFVYGEIIAMAVHKGWADTICQLLNNEGDSK